MNEQLTLIATELQFSPRQSQYNWKLSKEEKETGLAGVRNIRSILQRYCPQTQNPITKAS